MRNPMKVSRYMMMFFGFNVVLFLTYTIVTVLIELVMIMYGSGPSTGGLAPSNTYGTAVIWILVLGLVFFKSNFKFLLANGVSRRRFFGAALPMFALLAAVEALIATLAPVIFKNVGHYMLLHEFLYPGSSLAGGIALTFGALFLTVTLGWLISLLYYRSDVRMKVVVSIMPLLLFWLLFFLNNASHGMLFPALGKFFLTLLGFSQNPPNPYTGAFSMALIGLIFCGCNYLLIQKAELKE